MKAQKLFIALLFLGFGTQAFSQHVYPEVIDNCYLDQFIFESDSTIAKLDKDKIIEVITTGWDEKTLKSAEGVLSLQVLVNNRGASCLMSIQNETNMKTKKMNLTETINDNLKWPRMPQKVSVIMVLTFDKGKIDLKRLGTKDKKSLIALDHQ
ncbi:MAG: hypothetical protein COW03_10395 [Cytophagales bacterium CG12_big_fil_rev_8_21_14_0_65_40_12]|nr:MAG: hypothetical protein COW03_10395 [Cytophagales bacterium CG12_big_fil_rev_8_21_14_0_65_40_12]PIW03200.1 MAG: hypothetical protein COW40_16175 [Cytophagales bacterium CG17_big_fil_post_rev_8_21_14_2_50_40_13]